jgi:hypothetical protein
MLSLTLSGFGIERSFAALYYECFNGHFAVEYGIDREHVHTLVSSCAFSSMPAVDQPTLGWRQAQDKGIGPMVSDDIQPSAAPEDKPSAQRFRPPPLCEAADPAFSE